ncbi:MAG: hypothetical protein ACREP9_14255, partial [Candidatus Dormibacteraceae bacterium]
MVVVSLVLSGGITWALLIREINQNDLQDLAQNARSSRFLLASIACVKRDYSEHDHCDQSQTSQTAFIQLLQSRLGEHPFPAGDHLLLLNNDSAPKIIFDSEGRIPVGTTFPLEKLSPHRFSNFEVADGQAMVSGENYLFAAAPVTNHDARHFAEWVLLGRPQSDVFQQAAQQQPPLLLGAGVALLLAVVVSTFLAQALTGRLRELEGAAEDIA